MKLICPECRRENEAERIYCHECGARLDRSKLAASQPKKPQSGNEEQRRLRALLDPRGARWRHRALLGAKLLGGALLAAVIVQMMRAPDLPEVKDNGLEPSARQIDIELENATLASGGAPLRYTEEELNSYLTYTLKGKRKTLSGYLQFERGFAELEEGSVRFTVERSLYGLSTFTRVRVAPVFGEGKIDAKILGGGIGRMPLHPALMSHAGFAFADVTKVMKRDLSSIAKLGGIELHPKEVLFLPRPARP